jgi:hypothetical protein
MCDAIATLDPHMPALATAPNDRDVAAPTQRPEQFVGRHSDRYTGLRIKRRPAITH